MTRLPPLLMPAFAVAAGIPAAAAPGSAVAHVSYLVAFSTLVALGWFRLRELSGPVHTGYAFIMGALTVWLAGDLLYDALNLLSGPLGDVSPADVLWVSGYPLLAAGLIRLVRLRAPGRLRESALDALAMATVMAWLCWQFLILPAAEQESLTPAVVVAAVYPFGDVVLFAATALLVLAPGSKRGPARYLAAALTMTLVGDIVISMVPVLLPDVFLSAQTDRLEGLLLVANSCFVAALMHPEAARIAAEDTAGEHRLHPARVIFLGIALVTPPIFAGLHVLGSVLSRVSLLTSIALLTGLILVRFVLVVREQEYIRAVLAHQARHDQLTGLANRQALHSGLDAALARSRGHGCDYGPVIFYLDLNGFKQVNDRYGHGAGDHVLIEFARRLRAGLRPGDLAARLGGDEFVVLCSDVTSPAEANAITGRLQGLVTEPVCRGDDCLVVGVSIGVAAAADLGQPDADALLAAADAAMYAQKTHHHRTETFGPVDRSMSTVSERS